MGRILFLRGVKTNAVVEDLGRMGGERGDRDLSPSVGHVWRPIKAEVVLEPAACERVLQLLFNVKIVGVLFELESLAILQYRLQLRYSNLVRTRLRGKPLQSTSVVVDILHSIIFLYFSFLFLAERPCQGRLPRRK